MTTAASSVDVVVVGGGPGGSVCASRLAQKGLSVRVFEKEQFPRFHLGESLLPQSLPVLDAIGALPAVQEQFILKYGARFHDDVKGRKDRFAFADAWKNERPHAFQVPRDLFDALLLDHAKKLGAEVHERARVLRILREGTRAVGVEVENESGPIETVHARFVVDASGRDAMTAHTSRSTTKIDGLDQTAIFSQFRGVQRPAGELAGDIDIVLFREESGARPNWFWFIPFKDGRTSVGAVVSRAWIKDRRARLAAEGFAGLEADGLFARAVAESKSATELLTGATNIWSSARATADFSYRVRDLHGDGWVAVGDAGGFIDPLFSTGAHVAMVSGFSAADAIASVLENPSSEKETLAGWEASIRSGAETFILAVQSFYAGPLVEYLFAENKHTALRRSITSLLAGDVFTDSVWLRDARTRLRDMLAQPGAATTLDPSKLA